MVSVVVCLVLGLVLVAAAVLKAAGGATARAALATYGVRSPRLAMAVWGGLIAVEATLGIGVAAGLSVGGVRGRRDADGRRLRGAGRGDRRGSDRRAVRVLRRARATEPRLGRSGGGARGGVRTRSAAAAREPDDRTVATVGLVVALAGLVALSVVVLALAREIGMLRLAAEPRGALEVDHEGPEIGARSELAGSVRGGSCRARSASPCSRPTAAGCAGRWSPPSPRSASIRR